MLPKILVAGIGNIFLGDDGFGVEVVRRLAEVQLPENVSVADFGTRSLDLAYALQDGYDLVILVDAVPRGEAPGTLYTIEPDLAEVGNENATVLLLGHGMDPVNVLRVSKAIGGSLPRMLLVGCEPVMADSPDENDVCISDPVLAAVPEAVLLIQSLIKHA